MTDDGAFQSKKRKGFRGTRGPGGQNKFVPLDSHRALVKMLIADGKAHEKIVTLIINPNTDEPISIPTFRTVVAREIEIGLVETSAKVSTSLVSQAVKGNMTAIIWWEKTREGRREPEAPNAKTDPAGGTIKHIVEVVHGFPAEDDGGPDEET